MIDALSKIVDQPVLVIAEQGKPKRFFWFKKWVNVKNIMDVWKEIGCWWEGDFEKLCFRVLSVDGGMYEVYAKEKEWSLYKVYD